MTEADLRLLHEWLERPHVKRFYGDHGTHGDVVDHYLPSIDGRDPTDHYIVLLSERPVGMVQTYLVEDYPTHASLMGVADGGIAGVDILIGEDALIGQGLGTEILLRFVDDIVFARGETAGCIADPAVGNIASVRAFEKAGFRIISDHVDPADGLVHAVLRRDRPA